MLRSFAFLIVLASTFAPLAQSQENRSLALEAEGVVGYTGVDIEKWARVTRVETRDQVSYGVNLRLFLAFLDKAHVGLEVGSHHLFRYTVLTQTGFLATRDRRTVAAQQVGIVARFKASPKFLVDVGGGFRYLGENSLPAVHVAVKYRLFERRKISLPLGMRLDMILDDAVTAVPISLASGVFFKL